MERRTFICDICGNEYPCHKYILPTKDSVCKVVANNKTVISLGATIIPKEVDLCEDCEFFIASAIEERKDV